MSAPPPDDPDGPRDRGDLDFDAEFERIVAGWDPPAEPSDAPSVEQSPAPIEPTSPSVEPVETSSGEPGPRPVEPAETGSQPNDSLRDLFRGAWPDEASSAAGQDPEEHFVPPPAPPIPRPEPRRLLAWAGLLGAPLVGLLWLVLGSLPPFGSFLLFCWFVGGFGYLVATMKGDGSDGWDDGARV